MAVLLPIVAVLIVQQVRMAAEVDDLRADYVDQREVNADLRQTNVNLLNTVNTQREMLQDAGLR